MNSLRKAIKEDQVVIGLGIAPIWRVKAPARAEIKVALDWGAATILVHDIRMAEDAATAVRTARYAPEGQHGGPGRFNTGASAEMDTSRYNLF